MTNSQSQKRKIDPQLFYSGSRPSAVRSNACAQANETEKKENGRRDLHCPVCLLQGQRDILKVFGWRIVAQWNNPPDRNRQTNAQAKNRHPGGCVNHSATMKTENVENSREHMGPEQETID